MREQRQTRSERREEALFSLLMTELAQTWEEEALAEDLWLRDNPSAQPPEELDRRCLETIRRHYAAEKARRVRRTLRRGLRQAALAACLGALLFVVAFAVSERVRVNTMNLIIAATETNTAFQFRGASGESLTLSLSVGWIPERYTLVDHSFGINGDSVWFDYEDGEGHVLYLDCTITQGAKISVDTEDAQVETILVQGNEATLIIKDIDNIDIQVVWPAKENTLFLSVYSNGLSRDELLRVAESLVY